MVIGVSGINHYAQTAGLVFTTQDRDLFLPADPKNELKAWQSCQDEGFELWCGDEPLGQPMDRVLAEQVVSRHIVVSKAAAGRPKDRLFLATHEEALRELGRRRRGTASTDAPKKNRQR